MTHSVHVKMVPKPLRKILAALTISAVTMSSFALPASAETQNPELSSANYEAARDAYAYSGNIGYTNANWMSKIPGDKKISQLSIPGTHNSMSRYGGGGLYPDDFIKTQLMDLPAQLNSGIRYLDIRLRKDSNTSMSAYHGSVNQNASFSGDILDKVKAFLQANPNETVVMRVKNECNGPGTGKCTDEPTSKTWAQVFEDNYYNNPSYSNYFWKGSSNNPILNEVRGKIVVASNFPTDGKRFGIPYSQFNNQDQYEIDDTPNSMYGKWEAVGNQLKAAHANSGQSLFLNHLSGNGTWKFITQGAKPWFVASGFENKETGSAKKHIRDIENGMWPDFPRTFSPITRIYYGGMNIMAKQYIQQWPINHAGIVAADFPGKGLISTVIALNDKYMADDVKYIQTEGNHTVKVGFSGSVYLKNHYKVYLNGNYIMSVENGQHYYGSWNATDSGHELKRADRTLYTGDKVEVRLVNNGKETVVKSQNVTVPSNEWENIKGLRGAYRLQLVSDPTKYLHMEGGTNRLVAYRSSHSLSSEFDLYYNEEFEAYQLRSRYQVSRTLTYRTDNQGGVGYDKYTFQPLGSTEPSAQLYSIKHSGDGHVYVSIPGSTKLGFKVEPNGHNFGVMSPTPSKFRLIPVQETKVTEILSQNKPLPDQEHRSSENFSLPTSVRGKQVRVMLSAAGPNANTVTFNIKADNQANPDGTVFSNVKHGMILTIPADGRIDNIYIADPTGTFDPNGRAFYVEFYTLQN